jgi:biopolymer transport protein ExbB
MTFLVPPTDRLKPQREAFAFALALALGIALAASAPVSMAQTQLSATLEAPAQGSEARPATDKAALPIKAKGSELTTAALASPNANLNPYGLAALWQQGDWVAKGCLLLLALMSMASWYALLAKVMALRRLTRQTRDAENVFNDVRLFATEMSTLSLDNPIRYVADAGSVAVHQYATLKPRVDYDTWLVRAIEQALSTLQTRMQGGMALLATVGSTAPFVGLFGTVWAIYTALVKIGASGQASIDRVAGPVGEALIMTAIGLAVAVPAVFGYNWLLRQNKLAFEGVRSFGAQLHSLLLATTDLTPPQAPVSSASQLHEDSGYNRAESEFGSEAGTLNAHLSSPDVAPDIKL